jgi:hypothetical protein
MTACPRCDARFTGAPDIERQWIERHSARHERPKMGFAHEPPQSDPRKLTPAA